MFKKYFFTNFLNLGNNLRPCQKLSYDRAPLRQLLEAAVAAYVNTTHSRYLLITIICKIKIKRLQEKETP